MGHAAVGCRAWGGQSRLSCPPSRFLVTFPLSPRTLCQGPGGQGRAPSRVTKMRTCTGRGRVGCICVLGRAAFWAPRACRPRGLEARAFAPALGRLGVAEGCCDSIVLGVPPGRPGPGGVEGPLLAGSACLGSGPREPRAAARLLCRLGRACRPLSGESVLLPSCTPPPPGRAICGHLSQNIKNKTWVLAGTFQGGAAGEGLRPGPRLCQPVLPPSLTDGEVPTTGLGLSPKWLARLSTAWPLLAGKSCALDHSGMF